MDNIWYLAVVGVSVWLNLRFLKRRTLFSRAIAIVLGLFFPLLSTFVYWLRRPRGGEEQSKSVSTLPAPTIDAVPHESEVPDDGYLCLGNGYFGGEVVGESNYLPAIRKAAGGLGERETIAELKREPQNKYDKNAVVVLIAKAVVGYIPREDAPRYHKLIDQLARMGKRTLVRAQVFYSADADEKFGSVRIDIRDPELALAINYSMITTGSRIWPTGRSIQITDEAKNMDAIANMISKAPAGTPFAAYFTLRLDETNPDKPAVEVCYAGTRVGLLSAATGKKFSPVVARTKETNKEFFVLGEVAGNSLAVEIRLDAKNPEELSEDEVKALLS